MSGEPNHHGTRRISTRAGLGEPKRDENPIGSTGWRREQRNAVEVACVGVRDDAARDPVEHEELARRAW